MSEINDAKSLAVLLTRQREPGLSEEERQQIRLQCIELVDRYFRHQLQPILTRRFPRVVTTTPLGSGPTRPLGNEVQFTQLLNDFFVRVLTEHDDPFWKKHSAVELRNYASIVISNRGVRDALRRRKKQRRLGLQEAYDALEEKIAADFEFRFAETKIDPEDAIRIINAWDHSGTPREKEFARILRLFYLSGMRMEDVASDMGIGLSTAYKKLACALTALYEQLTEI